MQRFVRGQFPSKPQVANYIRVLLLLLPVVCCAQLAMARTWRVLRDGSGDFSTLQPAADAAAAGDTIWVGPGRYREKEVRQIDCCQSLPVYLIVETPGILVIGADRDSVVIGPDLVNASGEIGIAQRHGFAQGLRISNLSIQNVDDGLWQSAAIEAQTLRFVGCGDGLWGGEGSAILEDCEFLGGDCGVSGHAGTSNYRISRCRFVDNDEAINLTWSADPVVEDCYIEGGVVGITASGFGVRLLLRNTVIINPLNVAVGALSDSELRAFDNTIVTTGGEAVHISATSYCELRRNIIRGGWYTTILVSGQRETFIARNNELEKGSGPIISVDIFAPNESEPRTIDFSGNFWNTTEADSIAAWIIDHADDPQLEADVLFEPFLPEGVPTQLDSFGGFKAGFGKSEHAP